MNGQEDALTAIEKRGFNLFTGKAKCASCHFLPFFNGTVPPFYAHNEAEVLGVPSKPDTISAKIDADEGKFALFQKDLHRFAFKTPTVRNIAKTAPYMHNGVYSDLPQVIDFYNRGGGAGIGIDLPNQTLPSDALALSKEEQEAIIAFLNSLTDKK
jgi:cytochrome c peroxidase